MLAGRARSWRPRSSSPGAPPRHRGTCTCSSSRRPARCSTSATTSRRSPRVPAPRPARDGERRRRRQQLHVGDVSIDTTQSAARTRFATRAAPASAAAARAVPSTVDRTTAGQRLRHGPGDRLRRRPLQRPDRGEDARRLARRNGINGSGTGYPASVGLADVNAYWKGSSTHFGHSQDNQRQATSMDVVDHEFGHGIFQFTPGGAGSGNENGGMNESTGDIFGALTEAYETTPRTPRTTRSARASTWSAGPDPLHVPAVEGRRPELLLVVDPEHRGARGRRPAEPLVLPAGRGLEPGWRRAGQPDVQQLQRHRRRHPEGRQDLLQRPAEEDLVVEPQGRPQGDPRSRDRALPGQLHRVQRDQGRVGRRLRHGGDR